MGVASNGTGCPAAMHQPPIHPDQNDARISFLQESFRAARLRRQLLEGISYIQAGKGMSFLAHFGMQQPGAVAPSLSWGGMPEAHSPEFSLSCPQCSFRIPGALAWSEAGQPKPRENWDPGLFQILRTFHSTVSRSPSCGRYWAGL